MNSEGRFGGKIAVVTGAAQGIGRSTAMQLAREGAMVVLADRAERECMAVLDEIRGAGGEAQAMLADLESHEDTAALFQGVVDTFGKIDVSIHNVGGTIWAKPYWEYEPGQIEREIARSLWPTLWSCHTVSAIMARQRFGAIVNVGSIATRGIHRVPYSAAKGGVHALTACLAMELASYEVRVNCVAPGGVDGGPRSIPRNPALPSGQELVWRQAVRDQTLRDTPQGRFGQPDEIAVAICFLASGEASYITGQTLFVGGGAIG
ncbi:MAG: 1,6-dihydroxycyclohexa-2,4-diene-1-carboxylate dehydrogenase [Pigmentiphaga sp.]|uniref:1,6-dihydroxycyclohexa-2,4-diene-1-carboxylate dehydrogenase n=1 Tax=Pigmentiphaga sp. TaxID=1977564 RepID=UPI003B539AA6